MTRLDTAQERETARQAINDIRYLAWQYKWALKSKDLTLPATKDHLDRLVSGMQREIRKL